MKLWPRREEKLLMAIKRWLKLSSSAEAGTGGLSAVSDPAGWKSKWEVWLWCSHWLSWCRKATWWCYKKTKEKEIKQKSPYLCSVICHSICSNNSHDNHNYYYYLHVLDTQRDPQGTVTVMVWKQVWFRMSLSFQLLVESTRMTQLLRS